MVRVLDLFTIGGGESEGLSLFCILTIGLVPMGWGGTLLENSPSVFRSQNRLYPGIPRFMPISQLGHLCVLICRATHTEVTSTGLVGDDKKTDGPK